MLEQLVCASAAGRLERRRRGKGRRVQAGNLNCPPFFIMHFLQHPTGAERKSRRINNNCRLACLHARKSHQSAALEETRRPQRRSSSQVGLFMALSWSEMEIVFHSTNY